MKINESWVITSHPGNYMELGKKYGISPIVARILRNREITRDEDIRDFLNSDPERLKDECFSGHNLQDMDKAVKIVAEKIRDGKSIRIVGDYDIDGVSSVFILMKGIRKAGGNVDHRIPHRIRDGYGLNESIVLEARDAGIDTIITCDNGISAIEEIRLAKSFDMTVVVTDHHEVPFHMEGEKRIEDLPPADAVVDPHREGSTYPFPHICGAYVAYKFICCLYEEMGIDRENHREFLEIAAFATIGDVMPLINENRLLVKEGLKRMERTENKGLKSLISACQLEGKPLTPFHVGFVLGPCLNAAGRLGEAEDALQLLLSDDGADPDGKALALKEKNAERKALTEAGTEVALNIADSPEYEDDTVLVIVLNDCHESLAGIIAGRVKERTGRPALIFTEGLTPEGSPCYKGSGRSIESYNMFEELSKVKELFIRFGGHAMAAGLSVEKDKISEFRTRINELSPLSEEDLNIKIRIDMELPFSYVNLDVVEELEILKPYGTGNSRPLFAAREVQIENMKIFGNSENVLKGTAKDGKGVGLDCVYFGSDAKEKKAFIEDLQRQGKRLKIIYDPEINDFKGKRSVQIRIENLRA